MRIDFSAKVIIIFLLTAALTGVVGNRADELFVSFLPFFSRTITIEIGWLLFLTGWAVGLPSVLAARNGAALRDVSNLNNIGDKLVSNIPLLYTPVRDHAAAQSNARTVARTLFQDIVKDRPFDTCGIAIYLPEETQSCLGAWEWYSTPNHASSRITFSLSTDPNDRNARGIVGTTFMDGKNARCPF